MSTDRFTTNVLYVGEVITDLNRSDSEYLQKLKKARNDLMQENLKKELHPSTQKHLKDINNKIKAILDSNLYMVISYDNYHEDITADKFPNTFQFIKNNFKSDFFEVEIKISGHEEYEPQTWDDPGYDETGIDHVDEAVFYFDNKKVEAGADVILEIENMENLFDPIYDGSILIPEEDLSSYKHMIDMADDYNKYSSNSLDTFIKKAN